MAGTQENIEKLLSWFASNDINVEYGDKPQINLLERKVVLDGLSDNQEILYGALHEAGHFIVNEKSDWKQKYPVRQEVRDGLEDNDSVFSSVELLHEELEAWEEGRKLALKLGMGNVEKDEYWITRKLNAVASYVLYTARQMNELRD